MGVGTSQGIRKVRWGVARNILVAWVLTIPATMFLGAVAWLTIDILGLVR
jgi:PiT family inorganic phosphate transporter